MNARQWQYIFVTALLFWGSIITTLSSSAHPHYGILVRMAGGYLIGTGLLIAWWLITGDGRK